MTLMIALIGEQPLPNLLPIRHYHPDKVLLIYSDRTKPVYDRLEATLQQEVKVYGLQTHAFNIVTIVEALKQELTQHKDLISQPMSFNLTGGTKAMALAAYQVAQVYKAPFFYLQSEGKQNQVYHYIWKDGQLQLDSTPVLPECVGLVDLFNIHLGPGKWDEHGSKRSEGSPFEEALGETLREQGYEVMMGVKAMNGQIDIDVAIRFENRFAIIEAKAGNSGKKLDGIKQLSNAVRHIGTYTQTFYAITVQQETAHEAIADASRIKIISLTGYDFDRHTLSEDDTSLLISTIDGALK